MILINKEYPTGISYSVNVKKDGYIEKYMMINDKYKMMTSVIVARQEGFKYHLASNGEIEISRLNLLHS